MYIRRIIIRRTNGGAGRLSSAVWMTPRASWIGGPGGNDSIHLLIEIARRISNRANDAQSPPRLFEEKRLN